MKVRTPDGEIHNLSPTDAVRLMHTSDAVPVLDEPKMETRPASNAKVEKRQGKSDKG